MDLMSLLNKVFAKIDFVQSKVTSFPHITRNGEWLTHDNGHWTGGFWAGLFWIKSMYGDTPEKDRKTAADWSRKLKARERDNKTHDMGFIFGPSCVFGNRISADGEFVRLACAGARNMADLFEEKSDLILAWDEPGYEGRAIVDTIMNLPLMVWTSRETGDGRYREIALRVANAIRRHHIRDDGSIYHMVRWDPQTFEMVERTTHQGFSSETCWSRGQSWALYGFANMHRYTGDESYLTTSMRLADYFWNHLDDWWYLPKWDFVFRNDGREPFDASAGSVAASGMLLVAEQLRKTGREKDAKLWLDRGTLLVKSLAMHCLYKSLDKYGVIEQATVDKPRNSGVGESTMYGDYYFTEAVYRLMNLGDQARLDLLY